MSYTPTQVLNWAKIAQPLALVGEYGTLKADLHIQIFEEREGVQWFYDQCYANGGQPSVDQLIALYKATNYLYSLLGIYGLKAQGVGLCVSPAIISNPTSQAIISGGSVTFSVIATGTGPLTYQWSKDGTPIGGATAASYTKSGLVSGDAGNYTCTATNACGSATSSAATLTVTAQLTAFYLSMDTDPYPTISGGTDPYSYVHSINFLHNASLPFPLADSDSNRFIIFKIPTGEALKTGFTCGPLYPLNTGTIPGPVFHTFVTVGGYDYIISRDTFAFNPSTIIILS